ncbi:hypothetical protein [Streptomyces sp. NPDC058548]|uniref:hypothetical protein n=1 Tax=unclassified Streptomyces TaxID=2593676 RepID=UPI00365D7F02
MPLVPLNEVRSYAERHISRAALRIWPHRDVVLRAPVPGLDEHVQRVEAGDRVALAKYGLLGVPLVSVLRGSRGDWPTVRAAQAAYTVSPGSALEREAAQLRILGKHGIAVGRTAGYHHGVLFTEPVSGPTLTDVVFSDPGRTEDLLSQVLLSLAPLHDPGLAAEADGVALPRRGAEGVFRRLVQQHPGAGALERLVAPRLHPLVARGVAVILSQVVERLRLKPVTALSAQQVVYGDLTPEHVRWPDGARAAPVLVAPALHRGHAHDDTAKLVSRLSLALFAVPPHTTLADQVVQGLDALVRIQARRLGRSAGAVHLRHVLTTWLMDTVCVLISALSAPAELELPDRLQYLVDHVEDLCVFLDRATAARVEAGHPEEAWEAMLLSVLKAAYTPGRTMVPASAPADTQLLWEASLTHR